MSFLVIFFFFFALNFMLSPVTPLSSAPLLTALLTALLPVMGVLSPLVTALAGRLSSNRSRAAAA